MHTGRRERKELGLTIRARNVPKDSFGTHITVLRTRKDESPSLKQEFNSTSFSVARSMKLTHLPLHCESYQCSGSLVNPSCQLSMIQYDRNSDVKDSNSRCGKTKYKVP
jgi:hypothetical protein